MKEMKLMLGDNISSLKKLPDNSIDSIVTDPPYGLSFMNKKWDYDVPSVDFWKEVWRVLKPGGHILSFGGTRTYHRMVVNIEDAGFEIRDQIMWLYGSGFPKSHNIGKAVDKLQGNEREVVEATGRYAYDFKDNSGKLVNTRDADNDDKKKIELTKGQSPWEGWGTALKPSNEPICLARKPLSEKSVAENVLKWGTGGINVDGCRVGSEILQSSLVKSEKNTHHNYTGTDESNALYDNGNRLKGEINEGRFPANIILECLCDEVIKGENNGLKKLNFDNYGNGEYGKKDGRKTMPTANEIEGTWYKDKGDIHTNPNCPCRLMDEQSGVSSGTKRTNFKKNNTIWQEKQDEGDTMSGGYSDKGGASRFFYQAKVSKKERNMGLDGFEVEILTPTIKLLLKTDYNNKNFIWEKEDLKIKLADTDKLHQKDIEEYITTDDNKWNTELFGKIITEQFLMDTKSIILTATNSTTIYQTLNLLIQKNIKTNIQELNGLMVKDIKLVSDVENKSIKMNITLQKKDGYSQNVNLVELEEVWSISVKENKCSHPTLKPVNLMAYLCRLITPPNGIVLDPFMGSGSTGIAARLEGFRFLGMEMDEDYFKIAESRINDFENYKEFIK